jgi:hypothetical protein
LALRKNPFVRKASHALVETNFDGTGNWDKLYKEKFNKNRVA